MGRPSKVKRITHVSRGSSKVHRLINGTQMLEDVFEQIGGKERLKLWATLNPDKFYACYFNCKQC